MRSCLFDTRRRRCFSLFVVMLLTSIVIPTSFCQDKKADTTRKPELPDEILTKRELKEVEAAVDKGLHFLSRQQRADGSFQTVARHDPGISGLCMLAFMSRGHLPGQGPFGASLQKSADFLMSHQQPNGLLSGQPKGLAPNPAGNITPEQLDSISAPYNHGISSLVLAELYGMNFTADEARLRKTIKAALHFTSQRFPQPKLFPEDEGGWRYLNRFESTDADLSISSWNLLFLRSAKNSGFNVDVKVIDEAVAYFKRNYDPKWKTFRYEIHNTNVGRSNNHPRGMAGAGILSLALAGEHQSEQALNAARFVLDNPFDQQFTSPNKDIYPCYGAFYCSYGMFQLGGAHWREFYPRLVKFLLSTQRGNGSWIVQQGYESQFGPAYSTALTVLALTPPYQMLPTFQR